MEEEYPKAKLQELAYKWKNGSLSKAEQVYLDEWYNQNQDEILELPEEYSNRPEVIRDRIIEQVLDRVNTPPIYKRFALWKKIAVAASVAVVCSIAGYFYFNAQNPDGTNYANDVSPGKVGATLTLADGKKIRLADAANGELAKEAGISISKTANGQIIYQIKENKQDPNKINTLTTAKGETYVLTLPDQSRVWMNANSSLTYATSLEHNGIRSVKLKGEAYFEISKDKKHPFIVESKGQQVEVLGTHFNINSYSDEPVIRTTLLEGSVKVSSSLSTLTLKPNQQSTFSNNGHIQIEQANIEESVAWKNGYFRFNDEKIENIMRQLSRWYAIEVLYEGNIPTERFNGKVSRSKNISQVLKGLESTKLVHFKIEGRRITVMGE